MVCIGKGVLPVQFQSGTGSGFLQRPSIHRSLCPLQDWKHLIQSYISRQEDLIVSGFHLHTSNGFRSRPGCRRKGQGGFLRFGRCFLSDTKKHHRRQQNGHQDNDRFSLFHSCAPNLSFLRAVGLLQHHTSVAIPPPGQIPAVHTGLWLCGWWRPPPGSCLPLPPGT